MSTSTSAFVKPVEESDKDENENSKDEDDDLEEYCFT